MSTVKLLFSTSITLPKYLALILKKFNTSGCKQHQRQICFDALIRFTHPLDHIPVTLSIEISLIENFEALTIFPTIFTVRSEVNAGYSIFADNFAVVVVVTALVSLTFTVEP